MSYIDIQSKTISLIDYDDTNNSLNVIFTKKPKIVYTYSQVPKELFNTLLLQDHKDKFFYHNISKNYSFEIWQK